MMSTDDIITRGSTALSVGDYDQAIQLFTQSLGSAQTYDVLVQKSRALTELNNTESALSDATNAVALDASRPEAYLARGIANFRNGQVQQAQGDFFLASERSASNLLTVVKRWLNKCDAELNQKNLNKTVSIKQEEKKTSDPTVVSSAEVKSVSGKIAYTWYQTTKSVGIEINHCLANKEDLKTAFEERRAEISFPIGNGSEYDLTIDLFEEIVPSTAKVSIHLQKIEVILEKKIPNLSWKTLNNPLPTEELPIVGGDASKKEEISTTTKAETKHVASHAPVVKKISEGSEPASYPSSSLKKKNWDKIDIEIEEDMKTNKNDYSISDDPMKGIFKQIYDASDEDTKRAMMKSYLTSGGTVLSTNWNEVKEKDYEGKDRPEAPKGQEWKKWEK